MRLRKLAVLTGVLALSAAVPAHAEGQTRAEIYAKVHEMTEIGRALFSDPALSASGTIACVTCHDRHAAYGPPNALAVQLGGIDGRQPGLRAVPSLRYLQAVPAFTEHYYESEDEGDPTIDNGPTGGLTWDGRVDRGRDQARLPLLSPFEMANRDAADVVAKVRNGSHAEGLRRIFGGTIFDNPDQAFAAVTEALEVFQQNFRDFYPYSSKYDFYLAGRVALTEQEAR